MRRRATLLVAAALVVAAVTVAAAGAGSQPQPVPTPRTGAAPWPAPKDPMGQTRKAGLVPETYEHLTYHVHAHLDIFVNGKPVVVPAGIGIDIHDPAVHQFPLPDGSA